LDTTRGPGAEQAPNVVVAGMWPRDRTINRFPLSYVKAVKNAGAAPMVMSTFALAPGEKAPAGIETITQIEPARAELPEDASGLVLPGGGDADPKDFGQKPHPRTYNISRRRDAFEYALLEDALRKDMPVLAICRGMQLLNVLFGGTLDQHIPDTPGLLDHDRDRPRAEAAHGFRAKPNSLIAQALGSTNTGVNSHHHQGLEAIPDAFEVTGRADDGVIEAIESQEHTWVVGIQWHPEAMAPVNAEQRQLFETFVEAAVGHADRAEVRPRSA